MSLYVEISEAELAVVQLAGSAFLAGVFTTLLVELLVGAYFFLRTRSR